MAFCLILFCFVSLKRRVFRDQPITSWDQPTGVFQKLVSRMKKMIQKMRWRRLKHLISNRATPFKFQCINWSFNLGHNKKIVIHFNRDLFKKAILNEANLLGGDWTYAWLVFRLTCNNASLGFHALVQNLQVDLQLKLVNQFAVLLTRSRVVSF